MFQLSNDFLINCKAVVIVIAFTQVFYRSNQWNQAMHHPSHPLVVSAVKTLLPFPAASQDTYNKAVGGRAGIAKSHGMK